ncbi:hypothetical protein PCANC_01292 [Puccinia coronata f. sp. avenae]|uniref:Uncharacterized protein n=1 Tax=Puccinia coronata f. sp. avenae TaxID=200324 RepID=A0A2N5W3P3_9BASI|nr:hypothetical protein PCANC_01292 [Puccinia coronata f. sp. avenae]
MNPWKTPLSSNPTLTAEKKQVVDTVAQQPIFHQTQDKTPSAPASNSKGKAKIDQQKEPAKITSGRKSIPGPPPTALVSTPKRAICATSAPPELGNTKPRKSVKDLKKLEIVKVPSPNVPPEPELQYLQEFYQWFSTNNQVKHAEKTPLSSALISSNKLQLFKDAALGSVKYGQQVIHVGSNNVRYSQGLMAFLGLKVWCLMNLEEDSASLYNAAHRIAAITTFQELVSSRAYDYMNVNLVLAMDSALRGTKGLRRGLIAARPSARLINTACSRRTPLWKGVQGLHAIPSTLHAMCTPTIGVHMASRRAGVPDRRAEPARLSGGRAKPARPLDRRAGLARLSIREAYVSRGTPIRGYAPYRGTPLIRVLWYPYKGTHTLMRVPKYPYKGTCTLIRVPKYPYKGTRTLIRVPKYPYKGTRTLIRVPKYPYKGTRTLIRVPKYPYKGTRTLIRVHVPL